MQQTGAAFASKRPPLRRRKLYRAAQNERPPGNRGPKTLVLHPPSAPKQCEKQDNRQWDAENPKQSAFTKAHDVLLFMP